MPEVQYSTWKESLEAYVSAGGAVKDLEQHALMPLFHFCTQDLPRDTRAPELDDRNAVKILKDDAENWTGVDESMGSGIGREEVGKYLNYLAQIQFVSWPNGKGRPMPDIGLTQEMKDAVGAVGGRGGIPGAS